MGSWPVVSTAVNLASSVAPVPDLGLSNMNMGAMSQDRRHVPVTIAAYRCVQSAVCLAKGKSWNGSSRSATARSMGTGVNGCRFCKYTRSSEVIARLGDQPVAVAVEEGVSHYYLTSAAPSFGQPAEQASAAAVPCRSLSGVTWMDIPMTGE